MYCRKTPAYGSGNYAIPLNTPPKTGYQAPREDVARPFKAKPYGEGGHYNLYKNAKPHPNNGPAQNALKSFADKEHSRKECPTHTSRNTVNGDGHMSQARDARLNPHKHAYGGGKWSGNTVIAPGGGLTVVATKQSEKPSFSDHRSHDPMPRPRTVPKAVGKEGTMPHPSYGSGEYVPQNKSEHPDCAGFTKLQKRGQGDFTNLTAKPGRHRGDINAQHDGYFLAPPRPAQGEGFYASPVKSDAAGVAGIHYSTRNGGYSDQKYVPTHAESVMGQNAPVANYGRGDFASPQKPMVGPRYGEGHVWADRRDLAGCGAYVSPRSGIY